MIRLHRSLSPTRWWTTCRRMKVVCVSKTKLSVVMKRLLVMRTTAKVLPLCLRWPCPVLRRHHFPRYPSPCPPPVSRFNPRLASSCPANLFSSLLAGLDQIPPVRSIPPSRLLVSDTSSSNPGSVEEQPPHLSPGKENISD